MVNPWLEDLVVGYGTTCSIRPSRQAHWSQHVPGSFLPSTAYAYALERLLGCHVTKTDDSEEAGTTVTWWPEPLTQRKKMEVDRGFPGKVPGWLLHGGSRRESTNSTASVFSNMVFSPNAHLSMSTTISLEPPFYSPSFHSFPLVTERSPRRCACS